MDIKNKFDEIINLQSRVLLLEPMPQQWNKDYLEQVKIDFTFVSNQVEGNKISYGQTIQILKDFLTPKDATVSDYFDIINHKKVLDAVFENYSSEQISESNIKKLHKELMKNPVQWGDDVYYDPGKYKIFENRTYRSGGKEHLYASPEEVADAMKSLIEETNRSLEVSDLSDLETHPLSIATRFHYVFLNKIHPFGDGNGRIARIFMNLILLQKGLPPIFIKELDKKAYLETFSQEEAVPGSMLEFMASRFIESLKFRLASLKANDSIKKNI